ncbi:MAG TPA: SHOCT domain-containing protein [Nitrospira sp.]|nr:SHOCT domain-containing protein [Nitrospira sp.]
MNPWTWCGPGTGMGWMWIFPFLFFLLMIAMTGFFWRRGFRAPWCGMMGDHQHENPRQILDRRYCSGEVTREQYDEMKRNLER